MYLYITRIICPLAALYSLREGPNFKQDDSSLKGKSLCIGQDLVPGVDSLIALSTRNVLVKSVTPVPPEAGWDSPTEQIGLFVRARR